MPIVSSKYVSSYSVLEKSLALGLTALLVIAFVWVNLHTSLSFCPWIDEVMQVDAGINLHLGRGWVSTAWQHQSQYEFWAANNPLYTLLIYFWVSLVGITPVAVRALNYVLILGIAGLVVDVCKRKGLLPSPWLRILLAALVVCNSSITYVYRSGRGDLATLLVVVLLAWVYVCVEDPKLRRLFLFLCALLLLPCGLQAIPFIVLLLALEYLVTRKIRLADLTAIVAGSAVGGILLVLLYLWKHALHAYITQTFASGRNIVGAGLQAVLIHDHKAISGFLDILKEIQPLKVVEVIARDYSLIPLVLFLVGAAICTRKSRLRSTLLVGAIASFFLPFGMLAAGRYPIYYSWMGSVPVAILFVVALQQIAQEHRKSLLGIGLLAAITSFALGLPFDIWQQTRQASPDSYATVENLLRSKVRNGDEVFGDPALYYAAKQQSVPFYASMYAGGRAYRRISDAEASRLTLLIIKPSDYADTIAKAGGNWTQGETCQLPYGFPLVVWRRPATAIQPSASIPESHK